MVMVDASIIAISQAQDQIGSPWSLVGYDGSVRMALLLSGSQRYKTQSI